MMKVAGEIAYHDLGEWWDSLSHPEHKKIETAYHKRAANRPVEAEREASGLEASARFIWGLSVWVSDPKLAERMKQKAKELSIERSPGKNSN